MGYAIVLNLGQESAARVVRLWEDLARASISSSMLDLGAQPHISLAVVEDLDPALLQAGLDRFAAATPPLSLLLASAGTFPTADGVVFLAPVVTPALLELHRGYHRLLSDRGVESAAYYRPGNWVPHCTVAVDLAADQIGAAIDTCLASDAFGLVELDALSLVQFHPVREIDTYPLAGR